MTTLAPPQMATVHIRRDRGRTRVEIVTADSGERRALIRSFRQAFDLHGRQYARVQRSYWTLPLYKAARLRQWCDLAAATGTIIDWPEEAAL